MFFRIAVLLSALVFASSAASASINVVEIAKQNTYRLCATIEMSGSFITAHGHTTETDRFDWCGNAFQIAPHLVLTVDHVASIEGILALHYKRIMENHVKGSLPVRIDRITHTSVLISPEGKWYRGKEKYYASDWKGSLTKKNLPRLIAGIEVEAMRIEHEDYSFSVVATDVFSDIAVLSLAVPIPRERYILVKDFEPEEGMAVWGIARSFHSEDAPLVITRGEVDKFVSPCWYKIRTDSPTRGGASGSATINSSAYLVGITAKAAEREVFLAPHTPNPCKKWDGGCNRYVARTAEVLELLKKIKQ